MIRMREEMRKLKNQRLIPSRRTVKDNDFEEMVREVKRRESSRGMETGVLRSDQVNKRWLQDKGNRVQVIGVDVEALYPSLEAVEVAEIVYNAMMETKVKIENI